VHPPTWPTRLLIVFLVAPFLACVHPRMGPLEQLAMLRMPSVGAPRGGNPVLHVPFRGKGGGVSRHALCLGANTSGSAVAAISAMPMSLTLAVLSVGAGVAYAPRSCMGHIAVPLAAARPRRCLSRSHTHHRTPCSCTAHVTTPLTSLHAMSPHAKQLHGPHRRPPCSCMAMSWPLSQPHILPHRPHLYMYRPCARHPWMESQTSTCHCMLLGHPSFSKSSLTNRT
jgi:hypothetical protein